LKTRVFWAGQPDGIGPTALANLTQLSHFLKRLRSC